MKHIIIMPDLGQTTSEAKIVSWLKNTGDKLTMGDALLEVETDKATMEVEAYVGGYLRKTLANPGDMVAASNPVAVLTDTPDEDYSEELKAKSAGIPPVKVVEETFAASPAPSSGRIAAVPAARALAKQLGIDLSAVPGSGPQGIISKGDVERSAGKAAMPAQAADSFGADRALQAMAALTSSSKSTIPHFYVTVDLDVGAAEAWRGRWNQDHPELKASVNECLVRAASAALADSPRLNVRINGGKYEQQSTANVLVVLGGDNGLTLIPVADPHSGAFEAYLARIKSALSSAKAGKVQAGPAQTAPSLAISNLGMFGVKEFSAIIPPGCASILAAGAIRDQVVWHDGRAELAKICTLTVSADHRVVDGIAVARFLERMQFHLNSL
jgi:pyruvate dehydrogenase E2 component (dihydrolipoamide acetyltransferase)